MAESSDHAQSNEYLSTAAQSDAQLQDRSAMGHPLPEIYFIFLRNFFIKFSKIFPLNEYFFRLLG